MQAFTQNRRGYNFDLMQADHKKRLDLLSSVKAGIFIPLYKKAPNDFYTY